MFPESFMVRPSGNPLNKAGWEAMMGGDAVSTSSEVVAVHKIDIVGDAAYAIVTSHGKFSYKGTENDDIAVVTYFCKKDEAGAWKVAYAQRSTGRKPDEEKPNCTF